MPFVNSPSPCRGIPSRLGTHVRLNVGFLLRRAPKASVAIAAGAAARNLSQVFPITPTKSCGIRRVLRAPPKEASLYLQTIKDNYNLSMAQNTFSSRGEQW
jgi:hypothetical protein